MHDIQFLDVPARNVSGISARPSASMHDSQSRKTKHEPWDLSLTLACTGCTYMLNGTERTANEVTVLFKDEVDAKELELSLKELQDASAKSLQRSANLPRISRSRLIDISSSPPSSPPPNIGSADSDMQAKQPPKGDIPVPTTKQPASGASRHNNPIDSIQAQREASSHVLTDESSSDPLGHSPSVAARPPVPTSLQATTDKAKTQVDTNTMSKSSQSNPAKHTKANQTAAKDAKKESSALARPTRNTKAKPTSPSTQAISAPEPMGDEPEFAANTFPGATSSKRMTYGKGKLHKVSQATKQRACQQLPKETDVFDIPTGAGGRSKKAQAPTSKDTSQATSAASTQVHKTRGVSRASSNNTQESKTRSKRKSAEDEEFVPTTTKVTTRAGAKRKSASGGSTASKPAKKRAKVDLESLDTDVSGNADPSSMGSDVRKAGHETKERQANSRRPEAGSTTKSSSPTVILQTPLINSLRGVQTSAQSSKSAFKKPAVPSRGTHPPSTPTRRQAQPTLPAKGPHTPAVPSVPPPASLPHMPSSPPFHNAMEEEAVYVHHGTAEKEVLSSNSKPLPASPNAESTAISGHADREDVDVEKEKGDLQTARSDPFKQRAMAAKKTSFTRRLTGDDLKDDTDLVENLPLTTPFEIDESTASDTESLLGKAARERPSQPKRRPFMEQAKLKSDALLPQPVTQTDTSKTANLVEVHSVEVPQALELERQSKHKKLQKVTPKTMVKSSTSHYLLAKPFAARTGHREIYMAHSQTKAVGDAPTPAKAIETRMDESTLAASPQHIDDNQVEPADEAQESRNMDDDTTLVNEDSEEHLPTRSKATPVKIQSSPPGTPSSHSSTSAESDPASLPRMPTSDAEEMEWEASLQPHQRALHDLLIRVSKRVTRHVVDHETAVTDIAGVFTSDGEHLLNDLTKRHGGAFEGMWKDMEVKKTRLRQEMDTSVKALARERKRLSAMN